jgi:multidrug efflux pump subunit AcrB
MSITAFSIQNSRFTLITVALSVILGVLTFLSYPSKEDPSIVIRQAQVVTSFPGMNPERIENLITKPIEKKLKEIAAGDAIISDSKTGVSLVKLEVRDDVVDLDSVWQELRDKVEEVQRDLPAGSIGPFVNDELGLTAIASIAIWGDNGFSAAELEDFSEDVRDDLYVLDGTQKIELFGVQNEQIYIEFSSDVIQRGIDIKSVVNTLKSQNVILPGGLLEADGQNLILEPTGDFQTIEEIKALQIKIPNSEQVIRLDDIANIRRAYVEPQQPPVYFNGKQSIVLSISILDGINSIEYGERLNKKMQQIQDNLPWGVQLEYATFQPDLVEQAVSGAVNNLYQTLVIVLLVVITFLGLRTGLIVGAFVPITMLASVVIMSSLDVELQRMSIAAMIIALGMLVDNGIVVAESIAVKMQDGMSRLDAATSAGESLAIPLLTSTLTTILFFVPIAMAEGSTGEYTMSLAQVITIVLLMSWFLSLYMTPALCAKFLRVEPKNTDNEQSKLYKAYTFILDSILRFKIIFIVFIFFVLASSVVLLGKVEKEFFPLGDRNQFLVYIDLPAGSSIDQTDEVSRRMANWLTDEDINPEVSSTVSYIAGGGPRFFLSLSPPDPDDHKAFTVVNTGTSEQVDAVLARTKAMVLNDFPEARIEAKKMWMGGSESGLFELRVISDNEEVMFEVSEKVIKALNAIPEMNIIKQDWENKTLKLNLELDQAKAKAAGISSENVSNTLNGYFNGNIISEFREGDKIIPIVITGIDGDDALTDLLDLNVYSTTYSTWVPMTELIEVKGTWQASRIKRRDQQRTMTIIAKHEYQAATYILEQIQPLLDELAISDDYSLEIAGEIENQGEANEKLFANFPYAIALIILLLIWQFNSFRKTAVILLTIPLVVVGATLGLIVMDAMFGFMVILGFFSLAGIIINNGIVLIDQILHEESIENDRYQALINACMSRLRPILITTLTTVLGLVPLILSQDPLFYGMASAMAFGLAIGSMMTLGFVPALYALFYGIKKAN